MKVKIWHDVDNEKDLDKDSAYSLSISKTSICSLETWTDEHLPHSRTSDSGFLSIPKERPTELKINGIKVFSKTPQELLSVTASKKDSTI